MAVSSVEVLTLTVSVLSAIAATAAAVHAGRSAERARVANRIAEGTFRFQILLPALFEYRSAEMLISIRSLWAFAREHSSNVGDAYKTQSERDSQQLAGLKGDDHLNYLRSTIDFHRRQVSQFYGFLTSVYDEGGNQRKWIYTHWGKSDLEIIPKAIVPMEIALGQTIGTPASPTILGRLLRLYQDCPG